MEGTGAQIIATVHELIILEVFDGVGKGNCCDSQIQLAVPVAVPGSVVAGLEREKVRAAVQKLDNLPRMAHW